MKKGLYAVVGIIIIVIGVLIYYVFKNGNLFNYNDSIFIGVFDNSLNKGDNYVFTNYDDYVNTLNMRVLEEEDFINNNYVLLEIHYDYCGENNIKLANYEITDNIIDVEITYEQACRRCGSRYNYYLIKIGKEMTDVNVNYQYTATNNSNCGEVSVKKPIIYLYPEKETDVSVKLLNSQYLTTTYPKYDGSWEVLAYPSGKLIDRKTGREQYSLYWEGRNYNGKVQEDGFVVKGEDTISFLEEKLNILGLNEIEAEEFIIYWLPILENNKYNYIRFASEEEINSYMPLSVNPNPDTIIRVLMTYKPIDSKMEIEEQKLVTPVRSGFTLVEWGGTLIE